MENPYLNEFKKQEQIFHSFQHRGILVSKYAWAIPNKKAIKELCKYSPLVEIGAGTGYWANLVKQMGGIVDCYDKYLLDKNYYKHTTHYTNIKEGDESILNNISPKVNLFLCWPPYNSSMANKCLNIFKGNYLIYIGEGYDGCTGDNMFHEELEKKWEEINVINIPQWFEIHDYMFIYKRK
jgi:hypothetical protein